MEKVKKYIGETLYVALLLTIPVMLILTISSLRTRNLEETISLAPDRVAEYGFDKCVYDGYAGNVFLGAEVWYTCEDGGRMFSIYFIKWGEDALHMYQDYDNMTTVPSSINLNQ